MTLPDHQVHGWIASLVDRTADQLRADLGLLVRRVQEAAPTHDVAPGAPALSIPGSALPELQAAASADRDPARQDGRSLAADVLDAVAALDEAGSLTEILNVLVDRTAIHAGRVVLLLARGDGLIGWRPHDDSGDPHDATRVAIGPDDRELVARAARSGVTETGPATMAGQMQTPAAENRGAVAVPLRVEGHVVAVLYADAGPDAAVADAGHEAEPDAETVPAWSVVRSPWPDVVDVLARHAARCLESMTARRLHELMRVPAARETGEAVQAG